MEPGEAIAQILELKNCFKELEEMDSCRVFTPIQKAKTLIAEEIHRITKLLNMSNSEGS